MEKIRKILGFPEQNEPREASYTVVKLLISKEKWVPDDQTFNCFDCNRGFGFFWRKHHCRICGKIFCSKCSNNFLDSKEMALQTNEDYIRVCDHCNELCKSSLKPKLLRTQTTGPEKVVDKVRATEMDNFKEGVPKKKSLLPKITPDNVAFSPDSPHFQEVNKAFLNKMERIIREMCKSEDINDKYQSIIYEMVIKALNDVKVNAVLGRDSMDITKYIKMVIIKWNDHRETRYIKGVVCKTSAKNRKNINEILEPRILIIGNSIEMMNNDMETVSFQDIIHNEKTYLTKVVEKIKRFEPDILIVEKTINRTAQEMLNQTNITYFYKFKRSTLEKLARSTKAKIIEDLGRLDRYLRKKDKKIGTCALFYTKKFHDSPMENFSLNSMPPLTKSRSSILPSSPPNIRASSIVQGGADSIVLYFEGCDPMFGVSMTLSGPIMEELEKAKKVLTEALVLGRNMLLERDLILIERSIKVTEYSPSKLDLKSQGELTKFIDDEINLTKLISKKEISYTKINLVKAMVNNFNDLNDKEETLEVISNQIKENIRNHQVKIAFFAEICGEPFTKDIKGYSTEDIALGHFILLKANLLLTKCDFCQRPKYHHTAIYYFKNSYVKVTTELMGLSKALAIREEVTDMFGEEDFIPSGVKSREDIQSVYDPQQNKNRGNSESIKRESVLLSLRQSTFLRQMNNNSNSSSLVETNPNNPAILNRISQVAQNSGNQETYTVSNYHKLKKSNDLGNKRIYTFIECLNCGKIISSMTPLTNDYLEYSFTNFLRHLFLGDTPELSKSTDPIHDTFNQETCPHYLKTRVFKYEEVMVKFFSSKSNYYCTKTLNLADPATQSQLEEFHKTYATTRMQNMMKLSKSIVELVSSKLNLKLAHLMVSKAKSEEQKSLTNISINESLQKPMASASFNNTTTYLEINGNQTSLENSLNELTQIEANINENFQAFNQKAPANHLIVDDLRIAFYFQFKKIIDTEFSETVEKKKGLQDFRNTSYESDLAALQNFDETTDQKLDNSVDTKSFISETPKNPQKDNFRGAPTMFALTAMAKEDSSDKNAKSPQAHRNSQQAGPLNTQPPKDLSTGMLELSAGVLINEEDEEYRPFLEERPYKTVPVHEDNPICGLAYSLNSAQYMRDIVFKEGFYEQQRILNNKGYNFLYQSDDFKNFSKLKLYKREHFNPVKEFVVKISLPSKGPNIKGGLGSTPSLHQALRRDDTINESCDRISESGHRDSLNTTPMKGDKCIRVSLYFPTEFECIRLLNGIGLSSFIRSIAKTQIWSDNTGGKSKASFLKSADNLYIFKNVGKTEFKMFEEFAPKYFKYVWKNHYAFRRSILTKIYAMFEVTIKSTKYYFIAMENLFYGMDSPENGSLKIYDLKGSETNRYILSKKSSQVLLDTNFKIDRNGEPLPLKREDKVNLEKAVENDAKFLNKQNLIDYSMLLIIDNNRHIVKMGIIDYLRVYTWDKQLETIGKSVMKPGKEPTIVKPKDYKDRFTEAMNRYFMEIPID